MKQQFLTNSAKIKGRFFDFLENQFVPSKIKNPDLDSSFKLMKEYKDEADQKFSNWVGLYENNGKKYTVKYLQYKFKNLKYHQLIHEAAILTVLAKTTPAEANGFMIRFPKLITIVDKKNSILLMREYLEGTHIENLNPQKQWLMLDSLIKGMKKITVKQDKILSVLPKVRSTQLPLLFPFYILKSIQKDIKNITLYTKLLNIFYINFFNKRKYKSPFCFSHRDLHSDNLFLDKNKIHIIDLEVCGLAEEETELAITSRFFFKTIGTDRITKLIKDNIHSLNAKANFVCLTIFYALQLLANEKVDDLYVIEAKSYLQVFITKILPNI